MGAATVDRLAEAAPREGKKEGKGRKKRRGKGEKRRKKKGEKGEKRGQGKGVKREEARCNRIRPVPSANKMITNESNELSETTIK